MKVITKSLNILLLSVLCITSMSCDIFEQRSRVFDDDPVLEFFPLNAQINEGGGEFELEIQLIGPQRENPLDVSFSVDAANTDAVEGVDYEMVTSSPVTLPANSSQTIVTINILDNTPNADGDSRNLVLTLEGSSEVPAAENLKTHTLTIIGQPND